MGTVVITGAASGIGAAVRRRVERDGHRVVGVDLRGAEIEADLSDVGGRDAAVARVRALAPQGLDGLVACAGLGPHVADHASIVSVNYFGAVAVLAGLRDLLAA